MRPVPIGQSAASPETSRRTPLQSFAGTGIRSRLLGARLVFPIFIAILAARSGLILDMDQAAAAAPGVAKTAAGSAEASPALLRVCSHATDGMEQL